MTYRHRVATVFLFGFSRFDQYVYRQHRLSGNQPRAGGFRLATGVGQ